MTVDLERPRAIGGPQGLPATLFRVILRGGIWQVTKDGRFYGHCMAGQPAFDAAQAAALSVVASGGAADILWNDRRLQGAAARSGQGAGRHPDRDGANHAIQGGIDTYPCRSKAIATGRCYQPTAPRLNCLCRARELADGGRVKEQAFIAASTRPRPGRIRDCYRLRDAALKKTGRWQARPRTAPSQTSTSSSCL